MVDIAVPLSDVRLLIVEDEPLIALLAEDFASELGCSSFRTAATARQAMELIDSFSPQLALVDCSLTHGGPEFHVADALDDRCIPFIFTSGHQSDILPVRHRGRDFLAKPFSLEELAAAIIHVRGGAASVA